MASITLQTIVPASACRQSSHDAVSAGPVQLVHALPPLHFSRPHDLASSSSLANGKATFGRCASRRVGVKVARQGRPAHCEVPRGRKGCPNASASMALEVSCSSQSLAGKFAELRERGEVAVIPFIVAGDPDLATTGEALLALDRSGADIIELGVPYSDPLADGPVIQAAATRALAKGTDLASVLSLLSKVSPHISSPIVLFTYYNPIMKRGAETFFRDAKAAGAAGLVIPDIPLEETPPLRQLATAHGLELVLLTTPTTPVERMAAIAEAAQGFLYLVSLTGVTGARAQVESRVEQLLRDIKVATEKPVAVGFGISTGEHAAQVVEWGADGVIVGSKIVSLLADASSPQEGIEAIATLIRTLKVAVTRDAQKV